MKEYYPYTIVPQKVEQIRSEGIPTPNLPKLLPMPAQVRRKYLGTIIFILSVGVFIALNLITRKSYIAYLYLSFFIALISLVAAIFEFVQYGKLVKQYKLDFKLYNEYKEAYKKIKIKQEKVHQNNKDEKLVKKYQQEKIQDFFKISYDVINVTHNEYSSAKKRFKLFLEEYFPDEVLENVKVVHKTKKLEYVPDFIIQFENPKLNVAIEVEEPYSLSDIPENIQKGYDAKDRIRQRFANELGWIVIVISEEQSVVSPAECCKFIEDSIEQIFEDIKSDDLFANIKPIKKQKMLTGEERANLKHSKYRERYLMEAGLMKNPKEGQGTDTEQEIKKTIISTKSEEKIEISESKKPIKEAEQTETKNTLDDMKTPEENKKQVENEQMLLIKRVASKVKNGNIDDKKIEKEEPIKYKTDDSLEVKKEESSLIGETTKTPINKIKEEEKKVEQEIEGNVAEEKQELSKKGEQLRREEDILKDLYNALDKHSQKQKERRDKRLREKTRYIKGESVLEEKKGVSEIEINKKKQEPVVEEKQAIVKKDEELKDKEQEKESKITISKKEKEDLDQKKEEKKVKKDIPPSPETKIKKEESIILSEIKTDDKKEEKVETIEKETKKEEKIIKKEKKPVVLDKKEETPILSEPDKKDEARMKQELIDAYREKIEGAVFDKSWDELMAFCDEAIREMPSWDWAYYRRSTAWAHRRDFNKVIEDCDKAIGYNPALADAYYNRGTAKFFLGQYLESSKDYQKSIDLNYVKKADAHFNRGLCFQKLDQREAAYSEFLLAKEMGSQKAIEIIKNKFSD